MAALIDPDDLIGPSDVAQFIGLTNVRGVSVYRKMPDFPTPVIERGRCLLWLRADIETWHRNRPGRLDAWWDTLNDEERAHVRQIRNSAPIPEWLQRSLTQEKIVMSRTGDRAESVVVLPPDISAYVRGAWLRAHRR